MKFNLGKSSILLLAVILFAACKKEYETIEELDEQNIQAYRAQNPGFTEKDTLGSHFYYKITTPGSGGNLQYTEVVPLIFTVKSLDGQYASVDTFAASNRYGAAGGYSYYGGSVPADYLGYFGKEKGYPEALKIAVKEYLKKRNGEIKVIVPSKQAYGRNGIGTIPGNASLEYTIKVIDETKIDAYNDQSIKKYMTANNLTGFSTVQDVANGPILYYKVENAGSGSDIAVDSTISVEYTGKLFNGSIFDQAKEGSPATFVLKDVIPGWQKGIIKIKEGGTIRLLIPSSLAYGISGSRDAYGAITIPTASCLDFTVKVTNVAITTE